MARQTGIFLSGKVNNIVFYKLGDTQVARSLPDKVKQSVATKARSKNFGLAATTGKILREQLLPSLPFPKDKSMQSRFSGAISKWLAIQPLANIPATPSVPYLAGFEFNEQTSIRARWRIQPDIRQISPELVEVHIPAFIPIATIIAPANTSLLHFSITVATCQLQRGIASGSHTETFTIPYSDTMQEALVLTFPVLTGAGSLMIIAASLRYGLTIKGRASLCDKTTFMPSGVIGAIYS